MLYDTEMTVIAFRGVFPSRESIEGKIEIVIGTEFEIADSSATEHY